MKRTFCTDKQKQAFRSTLLHEWFHILGLSHIHKRKDSYLYVKIHKNRIEDGKYYNFNPCKKCLTYGPYECESIMHYKKVIFFNYTQQIANRHFKLSFQTKHTYCACELREL